MKKNICLTLILSCLLGFAPPDDFIASLSVKLSEFKKRNPVEQAIVIFNQEKYAISDTAFFQLHLVNEDFLPIEGKRIIELALFDVNGKKIQQIKFNVFNGLAANQLAISAQTQPGIYLFAFYKEYERASQKSILYSSEIKIVGTKSISLTTPQKEKTELQISYEGGALVSGCENTVIVSYTQSGKGKIKNGKNETVAQFEIPQDKITSVIFTPNPGETYYAEIERESVRQPLAKAVENKCVLLIDNPESVTSRKIRVATSKESTLIKKELFLVVTNRRKIAFSTPFMLNTNGTFELNLPLEGIRNGMSEATVFDNEGEVVAQRIFSVYKNPISATLESSSKLISTRENAEVGVSLKDNLGNPVQGYFSFSVYQSNDLNSKGRSSFVDELLYPSIVKDLNAVVHLTTRNKAHLIDLLLASQKSGLLPWPELLNGIGAPRSNSNPNLKVKGRAVFKSTGKSVPDSTQIMGYLQRNMIGYVASTKKEGAFELPFLYDFFGDDNLFYTLEYKGKELTQDYVIIPDEEYNQNIKFSNAFRIKDSTDSYGLFASKQKLVQQSYQFFVTEKQNKSVENNLNYAFEDEAMGVDLTVKVQDYIAFPTMEDLVREVIPFLQTRKKGNNINVRLLISKNTRNTNYTVAKNTPLFIIDGIPSKNAQYFLTLKPIDILTIKIINDGRKLERLGILGRSGIVLINTKKTNHEAVTASSTIVPVQGLSQSVFKKNNPVHQNVPLPDIRLNLFWTPIFSTNILGKKLISVSTSDNTGEYILSAKGFSQSGEPFEAHTFFNVNFVKPK
jgi:hypothetical protein